VCDANARQRQCERRDSSRARALTIQRCFTTPRLADEKSAPRCPSRPTVAVSHFHANHP
jgi:hypothetical protein